MAIEHEVYLALAVIATVAVVAAAYALLSKQGPPLPPGPPREPLIGNARNQPRSGFAKAYTDWRPVYGDVIYTNTLGIQMVVLNSRKAVDDIMIEMAPKSQYRPVQFMLEELGGWKWNASSKQPGPDLLQERKILLNSFRPGNVKRWDPAIYKGTEDFIKEIPKVQDISAAIKFFLGRIVVQIAYGSGVYKAHHEEFVEAHKLAAGCFNEIASTLWLVDFFPILRYVPSWFPGAGFRKVAEKSRKATEKIVNWPFNLVMQEQKAGIVNPSFLLRAIEDGYDIERARDAAGVLYSAGLDTTHLVLLTFVQCMAIYPTVQAKAQAVIDEFIKAEGRLPNFQDKSQLPYIEALIKEIFRINPPLSLGAPHTNNEDIHYNGYVIPKNTRILANAWLILNDKETWGNPEDFQPERFLDSAQDLPDPTQYMFGFGRRICPGKHLADHMVFHAVSHLLALYTVDMAEGEERPLKAEFQREFLSLPIVPKLHFTPRNKAFHPV